MAGQISTVDFGPPRGTNSPHYKGYFARNPDADGLEGIDYSAAWIWAVEVRYADGLLDMQANGYARTAQEALGDILACGADAQASDRLIDYEGVDW